MNEIKKLFPSTNILAKVVELAYCLPRILFKTRNSYRIPSPMKLGLGVTYRKIDLSTQKGISFDLIV